MTANPTNSKPAATSRFVTTQDGLRLHVRLYGTHTPDRLPVVCLPGLARTVEDFEALANALANDSEHPRRVLALDYRGRGQSDYDRDPGHYNLATELADLLTVLATLEPGPSVFVGTSRGGILSMLLAAARPTALAGVVLNDIGPVIEMQGLLRIKSYVGKLPQPRSFEEAVELLRGLFAAQFTGLTAADWMAFARRTFKPVGGHLVAVYDPQLATALDGVALDRPPAPLWEAFDALAHVPVMVIRGANSDLLSAETVAAMKTRRPDLAVIEVPGQGHAPLLVEDEVIARIAAFVARCDEAAQAQRQTP